MNRHIGPALSNEWVGRRGSARVGEGPSRVGIGCALHARRFDGTSCSSCRRQLDAGLPPRPQGRCTARPEKVRSRFLSLRQLAQHNFLCLPGKGWEAQERQGFSPEPLDWRWPALRPEVLCLAPLSEALDCAGLVRSCRTVGEQGFAGESMRSEFVSALCWSRSADIQIAGEGRS